MLNAVGKLCFFLTLVLSVGLLLYFSFYFSEAQDLNIFGLKTNSLLDLWSLQHFLVGYLLGCCVLRWFSSSKIKFVMTILFVAYLWEVVELLMEAGYVSDWVMQWKAGVELPFNRLIFDPLLVLLGALLARQGQQAFILIGFFTLLFLVTNLFLEDAMVLQTIIFN